jgi:hypothetical protein
LQGGLACPAGRTFGPALCPASGDDPYRSSIQLAFSQAALMLSACKIFVQHHDGLLDR